MTQNILEKVTSILAKIHSGEVKPTSNLETDLHLDSLDITEAVIEIEDEYKISINDDDFKDIKTVNDMVNLIETRMK